MVDAYPGNMLGSRAVVQLLLSLGVMTRCFGTLQRVFLPLLLCDAATMHILPGALGRHSHLQHQHQHGGSSAAGAGLSLKGRSSKDGMQPVAVQQRGQLLLVSLGMLLPLVLSAVFHHDHHGH